MKNLNKRNKILLGVLGAIIILFVIFNFSDRIFGGLSRGTASVKLFVPEAEATVFVDDKRIQVTNEADSTIDIKDLSAGKHTVVVAKEGYWPWSKEIELEDGDNFEARAFLARSTVQASEVAPGSAEHNVAQLALRSHKLPTAEAKRAHEEGRVAAWISNDDIYAEWLMKDEDPANFFCNGNFCSNRRKVLNSSTAIKSLAFYKNREDVLLFATGDTIYALEIDQNGTQNLQPIYEGSNLTFVKPNNDLIYVQDGAKIFRVQL